MNTLFINRISLILELIAGFMLAPELIGKDRIDDWHKRLESITSTIAKRLSVTYKYVTEYRLMFSNPLIAIYFISALALWVYLFSRALKDYGNSLPTFIFSLVLYSIFSFVLLYILMNGGYDNAKEKIEKLASRIRSKSLRELVVESMKAGVMGFVYFLTISVSPITLLTILVLLIMFGVFLLATYITGRLRESNFRYTLMKIGGFLFVLKIILQWLTLEGIIHD